MQSLVENVNLKAAKMEVERKKKEDSKFGDKKNSALAAGSAFFKKKALGNIVGSDDEE